MNIYDLLNRIITNEKHRLSSNLFQNEDREQLCEEDRELFDILKNISSIGTQIHNDSIEFHPMFVMTDGRRTFSVEDISEEEFNRLIQIEYDRIPLILRTLVSDILWVYKKEYNAAQTASKAYWELFKLWYRDDDNLGTLDMIRRAVCISNQTKQTDLYEEICKWLESFMNSEAAYNDGFFSLRIMELFEGQKNFDVSSFISVLDEIIKRDYDNVSKSEQAYELKSVCLFKLKKKEDAINNNLLLADYYISFAERIVENNVQGALRAVHFFQKGITLYRNNGEPQKAEKAHKRLVEIQKDIPRIMVPFSIELDIKEVVENIRINMEGLTFEESIIRMTQMFVFDKKEDIKDRVIKEYQDNPISHMFGKNLINAQGQTVLALQPLDMKNIDSNSSLLELHMHQNALEKQKVAGDIWIKNVLDILRGKFSITNSMLDFIVKDNPIVPEGRERIIRSGVCMYLGGEYYEAMHILAPQTENLFRNIAREVGGLTVTLEKDGSSMEKVLSSIFSLPELLDCYDNDILFTFKGLLNEQAGANIRNEVAHGIISEYACSSGVCLYFGAAIIKLLSYTSKECYRVLKSSERLKHFEMPNKDALKIIHKP